MVQDLPRHLGQHSGGMVVCQGQLDSVVPLEPATMPGRVVVQWDKEDCADMGIVKIDLLGLGMMAVLEDSLKIIREDYGEEVDLAHLPANDRTVYDTLRKADTVGMFQIESRAQMSCLPRLRPKCFYDIVVQVAIIRPGPIVGQMVNPYLKRRQGREPAECLHPSLEPVLARTLGVPLFQEQLLRMAMIAAGFTGGEAEELRRAFGFKRSEKRMKEVEVKLRRGMEQNGILGATQDTNRSVHHVICALWISRIACGQFCAACVCQRVFEMPLSRGVYSSDAEQPANGILQCRHIGEGRAAARTENPADRCDLFGLAVHTRKRWRTAGYEDRVALRERIATGGCARTFGAARDATVRFDRGSKIARTWIAEKRNGNACVDWRAEFCFCGKRGPAARNSPA